MSDHNDGGFMFLILTVLALAFCVTRCTGGNDYFCTCNEKKCETCGKAVTE